MWHFGMMGEDCIGRICIVYKHVTFYSYLGIYGIEI